MLHTIVCCTRLQRGKQRQGESVAHYSLLHVITGGKQRQGEGFAHDSVAHDYRGESRDREKVLHAITGATSGWLCYVRSFQQVSGTSLFGVCGVR